MEQSIAGNHKGALAKFEQALRLQPNYGAAYLQRGEAQFGLGDKQGALADFNQAIRLNPNYVDALDNRGLTRIQNLKDFRGGAADYDQSLRINANNPQALLNRGFARIYLNDRPGARADWEKAAELARAQNNARLYESATNNLRQLERIER